MPTIQNRSLAGVVDRVKRDLDFSQVGPWAAAEAIRQVGTYDEVPANAYQRPGLAGGRKRRSPL